MLLKRIKKLFRLIGLACLIILALCGIGVTGVGPVSPQSRERYLDNGIKTELVLTKDEEGDSVQEDEAKLKS
ncbi:hypothetical protein GCM10027341_12920 [Spirosoma knui]